MHDYHIVGFSRIYAYYFIGIVASFAFGQLALMPTWVASPHISGILKATIASISGLTVYIVGHWFFSRWIWRWGWVQNTALHSAPNFDGIWRGTVRPFLRPGQPPEERPAPTEIVLIIEQSFDRISLTLETSPGRAGSVSTMARLERENDHKAEVIFGYKGWSRKQAGQTQYFGSTHLSFTKELVVDGAPVTFPVGKGTYYTDESRVTRGEMEVVYYGRRPTWTTKVLKRFSWMIL